ncbi:ATP-binding protein [Streptomyces sp. NPDC046909]|uniref:ATP-binding protein n=1 Tax=Streptomyces sp. NPDC046909 TaxID=3155617 RepID=UPI0033E3897D
MKADLGVNGVEVHLMGWIRGVNGRRLAEVASAFVVSVVFFVSVAAAVPFRDQIVLIVVWGMAYLCAVVVVARRRGPLYGIPLAIAAALAFDSFYIPPLRPFNSENWQNFLAVAMYLGLGVLVGALAEATSRRALAAEQERGKLAYEQAELSREFETVRALANSLQAQVHESANQLHTIVVLVELGRYEEAVRFATEQVEVAQDLLSGLQEQIEQPALVALLLGKTAVARERGIDLVIAPDPSFTSAVLPAAELVTIVGNLIDNAMDALAEVVHPRVEVGLCVDGAEAVIEVRDNGPGIAPEHLPRVFESGWSTKPTAVQGHRGLGLALVRQAAMRLGGHAAAHCDDGAVFTVRLPRRVPDD